MDKAAEERKKKIRNLEYSLFAGGKSNNVRNVEIFIYRPILVTRINFQDLSLSLRV